MKIRESGTKKSFITLGPGLYKSSRKSVYNVLHLENVPELKVLDQKIEVGLDLETAQI